MALGPKNRGQRPPSTLRTLLSFPTVSYPHAFWLSPQFHGHLVGQYGYPQIPQSGPTSSNQLPRGFQTDYLHSWANTDTQTTVDMPQYHHPPQNTPGNASVGNTPHHLSRSSPFYAMLPQDNSTTTIQPATHQQHGVQYSGDRRPSFPQVYAPTPLQPGDYSSLSSPSRSNSSYSRAGASPLRLEQYISPSVSSQWPPPHGRSSRSVSNPVPATHAYNDVDSQPPLYSSDVVSSGNSSHHSHLTSFAQPPPQLPSHLGEMASYISSPQSGGPSFPVPHPAPPPAPPPAQTEGRRVSRNHPYLQSGRQTRRRVTQPDEPPVASGSHVTLDSPPPRTARSRQHEGQSEVSALTLALGAIVD